MSSGFQVLVITPRTHTVNKYVKRIRRAHKLATLKDYPPKRRGKVPDEAKQLARDFLDSVNDARRQPEHVRKLGEFVESIYFPIATEQLKPSTVKEYRNIWKRSLKSRCEDLWLRNIRTYDVTQWLHDIARQNPELTITSLQRVKSLLSGVFTSAKNLGYLDGPNPVRDAELPRKAPRGKPTHAYSLDEIDLMFKALHDDELASTVVAVAAFAGLRRGEIRGLRREDYNPAAGEIQVVRAVWEGYIGDPKTDESIGVVPVISPLRAKLDAWIARPNVSGSGWLFESEAATPIHFGNLVNRRILPALRLAGLGWKGFHAFRRGLGTNLHELGVPSETVQRILRHSDVATTQRHYIKPRTETVRQAMTTFAVHYAEHQRERAKLPN